MGSFLSSPPKEGSAASRSRFLNNLLKKYARAISFEDKAEYFLPGGSIDELVTIEAIKDILELGGKSQHTELAQWIHTKAKIVFALTMLSTFQAEVDPREAMLCFQQNGFTDASLPVDNPRSPDITQDIPSILREKWNDFERFTFWEKQWAFLVRVFSPGDFMYELGSQSIFPFTSRDDQRTGSGNFSKVYCVEIHPKHNQHPFAQVRQPSHPKPATYSYFHDRHVDY